MSEKYEMIKGLGLEIKVAIDLDDKFHQESFVRARDLEALLAKGVRVKGNKMSTMDKGPNNWAFDSHYECDQTTHTGIVIGLAEIPKLEPVSQKEIIEKLEDVVALLMTKVEGEFKKDTLSLIERLKSAGVVK
jgi:hypothetical protein